MNNQEAIEKFKKIKRGNIFLIHQRIEGKEVIEDYSLCDMAISALEKQMSKRPMISIDVTNENLWHLYCPTCGSWVGMYNKRLKGTDMHNNTNCEICANCGQTFDLKLDGE